MKYVGNKEENIEYKKRPGAYAIIINKNDDKVGIVTDGKDYFYLGGGIEKGETQLDALKRELIEESGYTIKNIKKFNEIGSCIYAEDKGFFDVEAYVYTAEFDEKITEPIEKDHTVLWVKPEEYVNKMFREWQIYIMERFIEERKRESLMNRDMVTKKNLENKYIFWDIDGTLAAYRFNEHVADPDGTDNGMSIKEIDEGIFLKRKPSLLMQNVLNECNANKNIIMGHCQNQKEIDDKHIWLDKYYPMIEERLFVFESFSKADCIIEYCKNANIDLKDVIYIDDVIKYLREAERKGIESWHISSFLDWKFYH